VEEAYTPYVARIGRPPGPLLDDYAARIGAGEVEVVEGPGGPDAPGGVVALLILVPEAGALLLDNVAVADAMRGRGLGGALIDHAEARARAPGLPAVRLYTHELMVENQAIYAKRGYVETHRAEENGLRRVFMAKDVRSSAEGA
jgi:GNAT superfamily N-acetyltransferase